MKDCARLLLALLIILFVYFAILCIVEQRCCAAAPDWCVEVEVRENRNIAYASGTLVTPEHVITNWHVVRDRSKDEIKINFPNGTTSIGEVIKQNKKWDVAVIEIPIGKVKPARIGFVPPNGARVTIHGYGPGRYRAVTGTLSSTLPSPDREMEPGLRFVDKAIARQGDSGGPVTYKGAYIGTIIGAQTDTLFVNVNRVNTLFQLRK